MKSNLYSFLKSMTFWRIGIFFALLLELCCNAYALDNISKQIHTCNDVIEKRFAELEELQGKMDQLELKYTEALGS